MKTNRTSIVSTAIGCLFILSLASCLNQKQAALTPEQLLETYKDSAFLAIDGDLYNPELIWGEVHIYLPAFNRLFRHSRIENNQIVLDVTSGKQVRISENIFEYVRESFELQNKTARETKRKIKRLNSGYAWENQTKSKSLSKTDSGIVLKRGEHPQNFIKLSKLYNNIPSGNHLSDYINFKYSDMQGNGVGDVSIYATMNALEYLGKGFENYFPSYYCCNACAYQSSFKCEFNIVTDYSYNIYTENNIDVSYASIRNPNRLPLVTIKHIKLCTIFEEYYS